LWRRSRGPEGSENLAFDAQHAFTDLLNVVEHAMNALPPAGDRVSSEEAWAAPAVAAFQQNLLNYLYTPGAGLSGVQMNLRAYEMQTGNFGFNTEFGKISINISVLVLLIMVYISLLMSMFFPPAAADIGPEVVATRQTISGILSRLATAVGERFGAGALKDLAAAGVRDLATDAAAGVKDAVGARVKDAATGAAARTAGSKLSSGVLKVVAQGLATNVGANIVEMRRNPHASWNWNATFAAVLAAPLGVGISHGLEAGIAKVATKLFSREAANVADQAAANAADKTTTSLSGRALCATGTSLKVGLVMSVAMPASNALATGNLTQLGDYHTYLGAFVNGAALHGATEAARGLGLAGNANPVATPDKVTAPTDTTGTDTLTAPPTPTPGTGEAARTTTGSSAKTEPTSKTTTTTSGGDGPPTPDPTPATPDTTEGTTTTPDGHSAPAGDHGPPPPEATSASPDATATASANGHPPATTDVSPPPDTSTVAHPDDATRVDTDAAGTTGAGTSADALANPIVVHEQAAADPRLYVGDDGGGPPPPDAITAGPDGTAPERIDPAALDGDPDTVTDTTVPIDDATTTIDGVGERPGPDETVIHLDPTATARSDGLSPTAAAEDVTGIPPGRAEEPAGATRIDDGSAPEGTVRIDDAASADESVERLPASDLGVAPRAEQPSARVDSARSEPAARTESDESSTPARDDAASRAAGKAADVKATDEPGATAASDDAAQTDSGTVRDSAQSDAGGEPATGQEDGAGQPQAPIDDPTSRSVVDGSLPVRADSSVEHVRARGSYHLGEYRERVDSYMHESLAEHPHADPGEVPPEVLARMWASDDEVTRLAAVIERTRQFTRTAQHEGYLPTPEQVASAEALLGALNEPGVSGFVLQHGTGEGKTDDVRLAASLRTGRTGEVLVLSSSEALVGIQSKEMADFLAPFDGLDVVVLDPKTPLPPVAEGRARVVFAAKNQYLFHFLHMEEAGLVDEHGVPLGLPKHIIADEIDAIDGAAYLSPGGEKTPVAEVIAVRAADAAIKDGTFTPEDFAFGPHAHSELTESGQAKLDQLEAELGAEGRTLPADFQTRLERAAYNNWVRTEGDDYFQGVTNDGQPKIIIVDPETGEPLWDSRTNLEQQWNLDHQALAAKHGLAEIPALRANSKQITVEQTFDRVKAAGGSVGGESGTAKLAEARLQQTTGADGVVVIPDHAPESARQVAVTEIFDTTAETLDHATDTLLDNYEQQVRDPSDGHLYSATDQPPDAHNLEPAGRPSVVIHHRNGLVADTAELLRQKFIDRYGDTVGAARYARDVIRVNAEALFEWDKITPDLLAEWDQAGTRDLMLDDLAQRTGVPAHLLHDAATEAGDAGIRHGVLARIATEAGQRGKILLINQVGGRGFDIKPAPDTFTVDHNGIRSGGVRSLITSHDALTRRQDLQRLARVGRGFYTDNNGIDRGNPGQTQFLLSLDDPIITRNLHHPQLVETLLDIRAAKTAGDSQALAQAHENLRQLIPQLQDHTEFGTPLPAAVTRAAAPEPRIGTSEPEPEAHTYRPSPHGPPERTTPPEQTPSQHALDTSQHAAADDHIHIPDGKARQAPVTPDQMALVPDRGGPPPPIHIPTVGTQTTAPSASPDTPPVATRDQATADTQATGTTQTAPAAQPAAADQPDAISAPSPQFVSHTTDAITGPALAPGTEAVVPDTGPGQSVATTPAAQTAAAGGAVAPTHRVPTHQVDALTDGHPGQHPTAGRDERATHVLGTQQRAARVCQDLGVTDLLGFT
jgi:hypothetical protein